MPKETSQNLPGALRSLLRALTFIAVATTCLLKWSDANLRLVTLTWCCFYFDNIHFPRKPPRCAQPLLEEPIRFSHHYLLFSRSGKSVTQNCSRVRENSEQCIYELKVWKLTGLNSFKLICLCLETEASFKLPTSHSSTCEFRSAVRSFSNAWTTVQCHT